VVDTDRCLRHGATTMTYANRQSVRETALVGRVSAILLGFDLLAVVPASVGWLAGFEIPDPWALARVYACLLVIKIACWYGHLHWVLRPVTVWLARSNRDDHGALRAADRALDRFPIRHGLVYALSWVGFLGTAPMLGYLAFPELITLGRHDLISLALLLAAAATGALALAFPLAQSCGEAVQMQIDEASERVGLVHARRRSSLVRRLSMLAIAIALGPWWVMGSLAMKTNMDGVREHTAIESREWVSAHAARVNAGQPQPDPARASVVMELPVLLQDATPHVSGAVVAIDVRTEQASAAAPLADGRWLLVHTPIAAQIPASFLIMTLTICIWAVWTIASFASAITMPIRRLRETIHDTVATGAISTIVKIPTPRDDELGDLTRDFNELLNRLRHVAAMANSLAAGQLEVEVEGDGELADALRRMVTTLHDIVSQLREAAVGVASAAGEIHAASRQQELAAEQQELGMAEISDVLNSLERSAVEISNAVGNVLHNAEGTLATTAEMAAKTGELDARYQDVGELLAVIHDVGDRSDLLALNGSLEATRAGESGRGFGLVAAEMRRLAERVTGTANDVRRLVHDITSASASTVAATAHSRQLAENTASAARAIVQAAHRQRTDTEHASAEAREFASIIANSSVATTQTRVAAESLKLQADQLERLVRRFELHRHPNPRQ
jgi:methyl-accepting chemotaxis protein